MHLAHNSIMLLTAAVQGITYIMHPIIFIS